MYDFILKHSIILGITFVICMYQEGILDARDALSKTGNAVAENVETISKPVDLWRDGEVKAKPKPLPQEYATLDPINMAYFRNECIRAFGKEHTAECEKAVGW